MGWVLRCMKNACGVDGIDSEFFKNELLKKDKNHPPYGFLKIKILK